VHRGQKPLLHVHDKKLAARAINEHGYTEGLSDLQNVNPAC
jgi:hypothetical protein